MGTYLSKPSTTVFVESGEGPRQIRFAVGEMQGWRRQMEDAHIAVADLSAHVMNTSAASSADDIRSNGDEMFRLSSDDSSGEATPFTLASNIFDEPIALFGVFDGHGGKEVAKFTQKMFAKELMNMPEFSAGNFEEALRKSFHRIDELLEDPKYDPLLQEFRTIPNPSDTIDKDATQDGSSPRGRLDIVAAAIAVASSPSNKNKSPTSRKLEFASKLLKQLGIEKKQSKSAVKPNPSPSSSIAAAKASSEPEVTESAFSFVNESSSPTTDIPDISSMTIEKEVESDDVISQAVQEEDQTSSTVVSEILDLVESRQSEDINDMTSPDVEAILASVSDGNEDSLADGSCSEEMTAIEVASAADNSITESAVLTTEDTTNRSATSVESPLPLPSSPTSAAIANAISLTKTKLDSKLVLPRTPPRSTGRKPVPTSASKANPSSELKAHRVPAGCTAIVALKHGMKLYVANAGDSRAVLCRGDGSAFALSDDHKPLQERELARIMSAGGFVTKEGRINGNLNLSRSLGDLKYKQSESLGKESQMITAEPDIRVVDLQPDDRFLILACDGVWDCLNNQQACDFVTRRLDEGMSEREIVVQLCHRCLADESVRVLGVGTDNMTFVLVLLR